MIKPNIQKKIFFTMVCVSSLFTLTKAQSTYANYNYWIVDYSARRIVDDPNFVYFSGNFTYIGPPTGYGAKLTTTSTNPDLTYCRPNGPVRVSLPDGSGGWFIAGTFTSITTSFSSTVTRNNIAHILNTGQLDMTWNPNPNNTVRAMAISGSDLFVGGVFTTIGGQNLNRIAKLSAVGTGTVDATWNPNPNGVVSSLLVSGSDLYVGGSFQNISGLSRSCLAKLSATGTGTADATWSPNPNGAFIDNLALSGSNLYVSGNFSNIGGQTRVNIAKLTTAGTGSADATWNPNANGAINTMILSGSDLYVGGSFIIIGGQTRSGLAKLSASGNGTADATWNPNPNGDVYSLAAAGSHLYVGGVFTVIGGQSQVYFARLSSSGTGTVDAQWRPVVTQPVITSAISGSDIYVGGSFESIGGRRRSNLVRISKLTGSLDTIWNPNPNNSADALVLSGNSIYVGGNFSFIGGLSRNKIAKISTVGTGTADASWNPNITGGNGVEAMALSGVELYVGGTFTAVGAQTRTNIAKVNATGTGTVYSWNPGTNQLVNTLLVSGSDLYVGGRFATIGGQSLNRIAKLNTTTGSVNSFWNPNVTGTNAEINDMILSGSDLYVSGTFTNVGGQIRNNIAKLNSLGSGTVDLTWNPNANNSVLDILLSGNDLYSAGRFTNIGGQTRNRLAKLDVLGSGTVNPTWNPNVDGQFVEAAVLSGSDLYLAGNFSAIGGIAPRRSLALIGNLCVAPTTPVLATTSTSACAGVSTTLTVASGTLNSATNWQWYNSGCGTGAIGTGTSITISPTVTTTYYAIGDGCNLPQSNCASITIVANPAPTVTVNSGTVCSGNTFTISPVGALTYTIIGSSSVVSPTTNTSYTVNGTDVNGCVNLNTAVSNVTVIALPTVAVNSGTICSGKIFTIVPIGASTYTIQGGSNTVTPTSNTSYTIIGTSTSGCLSQNTATCNLTVNASPTITVNNGTICSGNSFTLSPSGASTYTYSSGSNVITPSSSSSINVTGTSSLGCVSSNTAISTIVVNTTPTITVNSGSICSGNSFTIMPSGANTYTYSSGNGTINPNITTSYSVTGTSSLGCVSSNTAVSTVSVSPSPTLSVNSGSICSGNTFTINPSGASTYTYSNGNAIVNPNTTTSYSVTGTSSVGCISSNTAVSTVSVSPSPTLSVNSGSICSGNTFTINTTGASTYTYSNGNAIVNPNITTSYSITGTSSLGCISSNTAVSTVSVSPSPTLAVNSGSICSGNTFTINPSGASTYTYSNGNAIVNPNITTSYSITGTSSLGCISSNTAVSTVSVSPSPTLGVNSGSICSGNSFTIIPTGASTYTYSNGSASVNPTITTSYSVTGTSSVGCISSNTVVSTVSVAPSPTISVNSGSICAGNSFVIVPNGASTYTMSGGTATVSPNTTSNYSVVGTDSFGCVSGNTAISTVTVINLPAITVSSSSSVICSGETATLTASGADQFSWSNGGSASVSIVSPTISSTYTLTGTNLSGCVKTISTTQSVSACTEIKSPSSADLLLRIYPNPTNGEFTIDTPRETDVTIINALGQVIILQHLNEGKNKIELKESAKGIYFVKTITRNYKIIKE